MTKSKLLRMDNVGIVVEDLKTAVAFFEELGLEIEGEATVEGPWVDQVVGLDDVRSDIVVLRTPDGHSKVELTKFQKPAAISATPNEAVNTLGKCRIMFAVEDIDDVLSRLQAHGVELIGEVAQYKDIYRLCYLRGPEGFIVALAEKIG
jgi:catechol 2,3-dioxygenase-like lactoylglutathione lyase family enzyme